MNSMDYWFWTPVLFWVGLFFWFYRVSYPTYLKKLLKKGQKWVYIPSIKGFCVPCDVIFTLLMALTSGVPAVWVLHKWTSLPWFYGFAASPVFLIVGCVVCQKAKSKAADLYKSAYFLEYRKVRYAYESKGNFRSEMDVQNQTIWSFTKKLKNAESHGRLWKYVNAMAKSKKIPPDVYAETNYANE